MQDLAPGQLLALKAADPSSFQNLCDFWVLLRRRSELQIAMTRVSVQRDSMAMFGGPVPHYGTECAKGKLRLLFFASFHTPDSSKYDVDEQVMTFTLLLDIWCWRGALTAAFDARLLDNVPAHYVESAPDIAKVFDTFLAPWPGKHHETPDSHPKALAKHGDQGELPSEAWLAKHAVDMHAAYAEYMINRSEEYGGTVYVPPPDESGRYKNVEASELKKMADAAIAAASGGK